MRLVVALTLFSAKTWWIPWALGIAVFSAYRSFTPPRADMTNSSRTEPGPWLVRVLGGMALVTVLVGTAVSAGLMLYAGRRQSSQVLLLVFTLWVLSPFVAALWAYVISTRWSSGTCAMLYVMMMAVTVGCLLVYGNAVFGRPAAKVGFIFLSVPLASLLLLAIPVAVATLSSGKTVTTAQ